ncbi:DUF4255 domain-containing protein [Streptomyces rectiverticillatus]|uniref:DUF4255 domain-containing protein n=1 Tax=Streptomyces rectiverticillatus TaxID=173860 RepID=UPI0015C370F1|nr:DUF4255 domain-containing protein [Streptomyces rectiverticillatus]QLE75100.1 DUF4255 domain-containing protein [Streptomyces rectiverticillatus]
MSDSDAVAAVTNALQLVLRRALADTVRGLQITSKTPDEAASGQDQSALNVFLYRTTIDGAWRNADPPGIRPGETGRPALPVVLHYLLTPYTNDDPNSRAAFRILGAAMAALHDHCVLGPEDYDKSAGLGDAHLQPEPVRITPADLSVDDMSKLWSAFQSQYRVSVAYEARVVLLDSARPTRAPLPVVRRGAEGRGPEAAADPADPCPALTGVTPEVAKFGDELVLTGSRLDAGTPVVHLTHPLFAAVALTPSAVSEHEVRVKVGGGDLVPGPWSVTVVLTGDDGTRQFTRTLPLAVAPRIATSPLPLRARRGTDGTVKLKVECEPPVAAGQRVQLLVGDRPVPVTAFRGPREKKLTFSFPASGPGRHVLRLRVDGVDSSVVDDDATPPRLNDDLAVVVT